MYVHDDTTAKCSAKIDSVFEPIVIIRVFGDHFVSRFEHIFRVKGNNINNYLLELR